MGASEAESGLRRPTGFTAERLGGYPHPAMASPQKVRLVVGCMTGTSLDALDVALVRIAGTGLGMSATVLRTYSVALGPLAAPMRALAEQQPMPARVIAAVARDLALLHVEAISRVLASAAPLDRADLIAVHGQTVFHAPPLSWQLMNPAPIAAALRTPVVYDLRSADLAAGGQGAPITPIADYIFFRSRDEPRLIVNLGGFCNITLLPRASDDRQKDVALITGRDVCPCNQLLDAIARRCLRQPYDENGRVAAAGTPDPDALEELRALLREFERPHRSLGTGDEVAMWINRFAPTLPTPDLTATACAAIAEAIGRSAPRAAGSGAAPPRFILAGGSVRHLTLMDMIREAAPGPVSISDDFGVAAPFREAAEMAVLGALCEDRVPITLPQVTGVSDPAPMAGAWVYP